MTSGPTHTTAESSQEEQFCFVNDAVAVVEH